MPVLLAGVGGVALATREHQVHAKVTAAPQHECGFAGSIAEHGDEYGKFAQGVGFMKLPLGPYGY